MKKKNAVSRPAKKTAKKTAKNPVSSAVKWIATAVDSSDTCDGKAHVLGVFDTEQKAKDYVRADMDDWIKRNVLEEDDKDDLDADYAKMSVSIICGDGCEWNVEPVEIA